MSVYIGKYEGMRFPTPFPKDGEKFEGYLLASKVDKCDDCGDSNEEEQLFWFMDGFYCLVCIIDKLKNEYPSNNYEIELFEKNESGFRKPVDI